MSVATAHRHPDTMEGGEMSEHDMKLAEAALLDAGHAIERQPGGRLRVLLGWRSHRDFDTMQDVLEWLLEREMGEEEQI